MLTANQIRPSKTPSFRYLLLTFLKYIPEKMTRLMLIITGIIDSNNGRLESFSGNIKKLTAKTISQIKKPYKTAFFNEFIQHLLSI
jgi:hypothetical protein